MYLNLCFQTAAKKEKIKVQRIRTLKLSEITKPLPKDAKEKLLIGSVKRMLKPHQSANKLLHQKIITTLATSFNYTVRDTILTHILNDLRSTIDIALAWLFEEYSIMQVKFNLKQNVKSYVIYVNNTILKLLVLMMAAAII